MKISLFFEMAVPRPWDEGKEEAVFRNALEQAELADRYGFHTLWSVEHHFLEEYSHSSAPEIFLAAASQRTKNVRLGHSIVNILPTINHPLRVAERIATLDLVSNGRVELGTGEGSSEGELGGFVVDPEYKHELWKECLQITVSALADTPFPGINGKFLSLPPRNVVPKPKQMPHPPLWMACAKRDRIRVAAQLGLGALSFFFVQPDAAAEWVDEYYSVIESECVPIGRYANPSMTMVALGMCAPTREQAYERAGDGPMFFSYATAHYYQAGEHRPGVTDLYANFRESQALDTGTDKPVAEQAVGSPDDIGAYMKAFEDAGVDEVMLGFQHGNAEHEHVMEAIELVGREVLPDFMVRDRARQPERQRRVAAIQESALARKPNAPSPAEVVGNYSFSSPLRSWVDGRPVSGMKVGLDSILDVMQGRQEREERPGDNLNSAARR